MLDHPDIIYAMMLGAVVIGVATRGVVTKFGADLLSRMSYIPGKPTYPLIVISWRYTIHIEIHLASGDTQDG